MMSHAVAWLNIAGIIAGLSGGVMTYHFGLPNISVLSSGSYTALEVTPQIRRYQALSKAGIALISIGFLLQLPSAIYAVL